GSRGALLRPAHDHERQPHPPTRTRGCVRGGRPASRAEAGMSDEGVLERDERRAISLAIHGHMLERWHVGFRALYRLTRDPGDTRQAFIIGAVLDRNYIAEPFFRFMIDPGGFALMREQ